MLLIIYLKTIMLLAVTSFCGVSLLRRATEDKRAEVIIPAGIVFGIALYIFLLNLVAHIIKGIPGFYLALLMELLLTVVIKLYSKTDKLTFPVGRVKTVWVFSLMVWGIFLYIITATGHASSGDASNHYILASLFLRGDYPIHSPYQPDFLAYYHIGGAQLLGALKGITDGSFEFLFSLFSLISLLSISQVLTFILKPKDEKAIPLPLFFLVPAVGIISLGQFMLSWPFVFELPQISNGLLNWLAHLPIYGVFGASTSLDSFALFFHRMLSISFFVALLPLILIPKMKSKAVPSLLILLSLSAIALTDESVFIVTVVAVFIITAFTLFRKSYLMWAFLCISIVTVSLIQGGIITDSIFSRNGKSMVLVFPKDETGPLTHYGSYRTTRIRHVQSYLFPDNENYRPFRWFHPSILWQLGLMLSFSLITLYLYRKKDPIYFRLNYLMWLLFISSVTALLAFLILVPKGMYHINGFRFLGMSFHFSGLGIALFIIYGQTTLKFNKLLKLLIKLVIIWLLIFSIVPPLMQLFPRKGYNWFAYTPPQTQMPLYNWIRQNIPFEKRGLMLTDPNPSSSSNTDLVTQVGTFTPVWTNEYYAQGFDTNPTYSDVFYTLNPELVKLLRLDFIVISDQYLSILPSKRVADLKNQNFFQPTFTDWTNNYTVLRILPKYLKEGENLNGTFYQLVQIAPVEGKYFVEEVPIIPEDMHRAVRLALYQREVYEREKFFPFSDAFYNFVIDVDMKYYGVYRGKFDYLILSSKTDPKTICNCATKLLWEGVGNGIKLWETI